MYLLGATKNQELVFADVRITERNGYPEFTASFNTVRPFDGDNPYITAEEYYETLVDEMDDGWKWEMCKYYDLKPSELAEWLMNQWGFEVEDYIDCSLYPETIYVDGKDYYFESVGCGQHDTRNEMGIYTNKDLYDKIHELWDEYHLKEINQDVIVQVLDVLEKLGSIDTENWIRNYIREELV